MAVLDRLSRLRGPVAEPGIEPRAQSAALAGLARHYRDRLLRETDLEQLTSLPRRSLRARIESLVSGMIREEGRLISYEDRVALINSILDETVGYGPLEQLFHDPTLTEIMVNSAREVYIERAGKDELELRTDVQFEDESHILHIIDRIVAPLGRRIDESNPMVDARLPDGSRVNAIIRPLSIDGPVITIRRFRKKPYAIDDLKANLTLTPEMGTFLTACVKAKLNILVSGGTGSGKTTTLNVLSAFIPRKERIVTIEEAAELRFYEHHPHVVRLESRPPNIEGTGEVTIRQLVRNALRMRPNRIIVGEVRGAEALDMLQAMNTGHEGSLTTIHANSVKDAFSRLEAMTMMAELDLPLPAIREYIIGALNIVVQQNRLVDNTRRMVAISEIQGVKDGQIALKDVFTFTQTGVTPAGKVTGYFAATGFVPKCVERMKAFGIEVLLDIFDKQRQTWI